MEKKKIRYCNQCGKEIQLEAGLKREEYLSVEQEWGYFSEKDGELHRFCLCEACYDALVRGFCLPVEVTQLQEYL